MALAEIKTDDEVIQFSDSRNVICMLGKNSTPAGTLFHAYGETDTYAFGLAQTASAYGLTLYNAAGQLLFDAIQHGRVARPVDVMFGNIVGSTSATVSRIYPSGRTYAVWIHSPVSSFRIRPGSVTVGGVVNYVYYFDDQSMTVDVDGNVVSITAERDETGSPNGSSATPFEGAGKLHWRATVLDVTNF